MIAANLIEAEKTPDWGMKKLRTHVAVLHQSERFMCGPDYERFRALCDRLRGRMSMLQRGH